MTKHSNKSAYPLKPLPIKKDYFVGTDSQDGNKTVNFEFEKVGNLLNELSGTPVISYVFKTSYDIPGDTLIEGNFLSEGNTTVIADITRLHVNKNDLSSHNFKTFYQYINTNKEDFLFKLKSASDPNHYVIFNITAITEFQDLFYFDVEVYKPSAVLTELVNFTNYFFEFDLKSDAADQDNEFRIVSGNLFIGGSGVDLSDYATKEAEINDKIDYLFTQTNLTVSEKELVIFSFRITQYGSFTTFTRKYVIPGLGKGIYNTLIDHYNSANLEIIYEDSVLNGAVPEDIESGLNNVIFDLGDITSEDYLDYINTESIAELPTGYDLTDDAKIYYFKWTDAGVTYMYFFNEEISAHSYQTYGVDGNFTFAAEELVLFYQSDVAIEPTPAPVHWADILEIPTEFSPAAHTHDISEVTGLQDELDGLQGNIETLSDDIDAELLLKADLVGGFVPSYQLPAFVDDVLEFDTLALFPASGESGKIYIAIDTKRQFRWSGSSYIQITNGLIGSTSDVPEGTNLYFTTARVLATVLAGLSSSSGTFTSSDTVLAAFGKIKYLIDNITTTYQAILTDVNFGAFIGARSAKSTPVDADYEILMDSADSNKAKKISWADKKATLLAYFDTKYQTVDTKQKTISGNVTLDDTYNGCIVKIKATANITVPGNLMTNFSATFDAWTGATGTFVEDAGTSANIVETTLILAPGKMATLYKDGATTDYKLKGETS